MNAWFRWIAGTLCSVSLVALLPGVASAQGSPQNSDQGRILARFHSAGTACGVVCRAG